MSSENSEDVEIIEIETGGSSTPSSSSSLSPSPSFSGFDWMLDGFKMVSWKELPNEVQEYFRAVARKIEKDKKGSEKRIAQLTRENQQQVADYKKSKSKYKSLIVSKNQELRCVQMELEREKRDKANFNATDMIRKAAVEVEMTEADIAKSMMNYVTKMRQKVEQLQDGFVAAVDSFRHSISSRQMVSHSSSTRSPEEDLINVRGQINDMFGQLATKLERWERTRLELEDDITATGEVLGKFNNILTGNRESFPSNLARLDIPFVGNPSTSNPPLTVVPSQPLYITKTIFSPEKLRKLSAYVPPPQPIVPSPPFPPTLLPPSFPQPDFTHQQQRITNTPTAVPPQPLTPFLQQEPPQLRIVYAKKSSPPPFSSPTFAQPASHPHPQHPNQPLLPVITNSMTSPPLGMVVQPTYSQNRQPPNQTKKKNSASLQCSFCREFLTTEVHLRLHYKVIHKWALTPPTEQTTPLSAGSSQTSPSYRKRKCAQENFNVNLPSSQ